jgi:hypothetical protein
MKIKAVLIGLVILFVTGLLIKVKFLQIEKENLILDRDRLETNVYELTKEGQDSRTLVLKEKELSGKLRAEVDELAEKLKVKPKQIEKIIHIETTVIDTVIKEIPVKQLTDKSWSFTDTINKCSVYKGVVSLTGDSINVKRTSFIDQNQTTPVYYWKRPKQFLFIHYGKRKNYVEYSSKCGDVKTEEFQFIK